MKLLITIFLQAYFVLSISGQHISVGTGGDYATLEDAQSDMDPGDTIFILDGTYSNDPQFLTIEGTASDPIVIQSLNKHGAIFQGGSEAIHLTNCSYVQIIGLVIEQQTGNGMNIDDGGDYNTPAHHITIKDCLFRDMNAAGNNDLLKLSGLDDFIIEGCEFLNGGGGGSGIDMVGCHQGIIQDNIFDDAGTSGIQAKGGTQFILMRRNIFKDIDQRAINLGGSTGLQFFRPPLPDPIVNAFEAADLQVFSNIFIRSWSPIAYVGCVRVKVYNNTIYDPENWVIRILQETTVNGFLTCADNEFRNNIVYLTQDLTEVNIGPNTNAGSFIFTNNLWFNLAQSTWPLVLPVVDSNQLIGDPLFTNSTLEDFTIPTNSPCVNKGVVRPDPQTDFLQNFYANPPSIGAFEGSNITTATPYIIESECISMYPNPSANRIKVEGDFSDAEILIVNSAGTIIQDYSSASSPLVIDLDALPSGIYFISITSNTYPNMQVTRMLLKEN